MSQTKQILRQHNQSYRLVLGTISVVIIVLAGIFIGQQATSNAVPKLSPTQYIEQFQNTNTSHLLIDVRTPEEFASEHIAGAINISLQSISNRLDEIPHDRPVVLYCHSGNRSGQAAHILSQAGYTNIYDLGGILLWIATGFPTVQ